MFKGRTYRLLGHRNLSVGFDGIDRKGGHAGKDVGFCTVMYASEFNQGEKEAMARRVLAALTATSHMSLAELEDHSAAAARAQDRLRLLQLPEQLQADLQAAWQLLDDAGRRAEAERVLAFVHRHLGPG